MLGFAMHFKVFLVAVVFAFTCSAVFPQKRDHNEIIRVPSDDRLMNEAIAKAQATLEQFLSVWRSKSSDTSDFRLKVRVWDGPNAEHFWVAPFRPAQSGFEGILANEPRLVKNVRNGQKISFLREDISDWGYVRDGKQVGSFTVCVMLKTAPTDQSDYYRKNYGFDC